MPPASDNQPATPASDKNAAQIKHLQFKRTELAAKLERFKDTPNTEDHDHDALRQRARNGIKAIDAELKNLGFSGK